MKLILILTILFSFQAHSESTATGIPLDTEWKLTIYRYAQANVKHPSWGLAHSERNYQVTKILAEKENILLDEDVLFVASFLHDIGGMAAFEKPGVDHAVRSVEVIGPVLKETDFPMEKWPQVKEMILGHVYYQPALESLQAKAFRDADILDFLGAIGAARIFAITQEPGEVNPTLNNPFAILNKFVVSMAGKCSLKTSQDEALKREKELKLILESIAKQSFDGKAL